MTRIISVDSITNINFSLLDAEGVSHVLTDIESTVAPYGVAEVDPSIKKYLDNQRELGHIATLSLMTNKTDEAFVSSIAEQLNADHYFIPRTRAERKPKPAMIYRAMEQLSANTNQLAVVGDKFTADMAAAKAAGAAYGYYVRRLGSTDHPGDRWIRRPYERLRRYRQLSNNRLLTS